MDILSIVKLVLIGAVVIFIIGMFGEESDTNE